MKLRRYARSVINHRYAHVLEAVLNHNMRAPGIAYRVVDQILQARAQCHRLRFERLALAFVLHVVAIVLGILGL